MYSPPSTGLIVRRVHGCTDDSSHPKNRTVLLQKHLKFNLWATKAGPQLRRRAARGDGGQGRGSSGGAARTTEARATAPAAERPRGYGGEAAAPAASSQGRGSGGGAARTTEARAAAPAAERPRGDVGEAVAPAASGHGRWRRSFSVPQPGRT